MKNNKATIQDIADHAKVSKATVSRVLNNRASVNETKRKAVLASMRQLGFRPNMFARGLASGQSMTIGVVTQNIGSPYYDMVTQGVINGLGGSGYSPIFVDGQWQAGTGAEVIRTLVGRQVDGLLVVGGDVPVDELNDLRERLPTVVVGRSIQGWDDQCIYIDNFDASYQATKYLIDFGHRQIAIVTGLSHHPDAVQRFEGYQKALGDHGIAYDPDLVYQGNFSGQSGVLAVNSLLTKGKNFTAVFCANDMVAFGARLALYKQGLRVPEEVSIIGFDDQAESAFMTPPLTTVHQPATEMGALAAEAIVQLIRGERCELPSTMPAKLQIRESVARLR